MGACWLRRLVQTHTKTVVVLASHMHASQLCHQPKPSPPFQETPYEQPVDLLTGNTPLESSKDTRAIFMSAMSLRNLATVLACMPGCDKLWFMLCEIGQHGDSVRAWLYAFRYLGYKGGKLQRTVPSLTNNNRSTALCTPHSAVCTPSEHANLWMHAVPEHRYCSHASSSFTRTIIKIANSRNNHTAGIPLA